MTRSWEIFSRAERRQEVSLWQTPPTKMVSVSQFTIQFSKQHRTRFCIRLSYLILSGRNLFSFSVSITDNTKVPPRPTKQTPQLRDQQLIGPHPRWQGASPASRGGSLSRAVVWRSPIGRRRVLSGDCALVGLAVSRVGRGLAWSEESNKRHTRESFSLSTRSVSTCAQRGDSVWSWEIGDLPLTEQLET